MKSFPSFLCALFLAAVAVDAAADSRIVNLAGTGAAGGSGDGGPATAAQLNNPFGMARGPDGALYVCEFSGQRVRRIAKDGTITTVAGTGQPGGSGDGGPATAAKLNEPHEIRFDAQGNFYLADMKNNAIRRVDGKTGIITTFAGSGTAGYSGDGGPASAAQLKAPISIQFGPGGDLYICDIGNHAIRKVDAKTGVISTAAGTGKAGPTPDDSPIAGTPLNGPRSIDFDRAGHLWLCAREANEVLEFDFAAGLIHRRAGTGKKGFTGNGGPALEATFSGPKGIALDAEGNVWLADTENHAIRRIVAKTGVLELVVGTGKKGDGPEGDPLACQLSRPHGIFVDRDGAAYIGDAENHRVRMLK